MTTTDIQDVVRKFADATSLAAEAGFAGVEIHAAHGYLLTQFLSSESNKREDAYGGTASGKGKDRGRNNSSESRLLERVLKV